MSIDWSRVIAVAGEAAARVPYRWECERADCDGEPHGTITHKHARAKQRTPEGDDWWIWLLLCGRGWGKTHTGAETFLSWVTANPVDAGGRPTWWLMAGPRFEVDTMNTLWAGPSGVRNALERRNIEYRLHKSEHKVTLATGQVIVLSHGEDENLGRGGNWAGAWLDEVGMYRRIGRAWGESLVPSIRAQVTGWRPRVLLTTTPTVRYKDAWELLQKLDKSTDGHAVVTHGPTWENTANIAPDVLAGLEAQYPVGTRLRRQELNAELLDEVEGALWTLDIIDKHRVTAVPETLDRVVVAVDPAVTATAKSDHTGIVAAAAVGRRLDRQFYVLRDVSMKGQPHEWGRAAVLLWHELEADAIVYETNQGGDMVRDTILVAARDLLAAGTIKSLPKVKGVRASRGKAVRAEPIAARYMQGRVHHVGDLADLENQLCTWAPGEASPDRLDAAVWALSELSEAGSGTTAAPVLNMW